VDNAVQVPVPAPFGWCLAWGKMGVGKTLLGLNSPWRPVHIIDLENSSYDYFMHMDRLTKMGTLRGPFTRSACYTLADYEDAYKKLVAKKQHYGTIVLDTIGQVANWIGENQFMKDARQADKQGQVVWGRVRDRIRNQLNELGSLCDMLIVTAHERVYEKKGLLAIISPRCNPTVLEVVSLSIRLERGANQKLPTAYFSANGAKSRLSFFPPQIKDFSMDKLLEYVAQPADWGKLKDGEMAPEQPVPASGFSEEGQFEQ